ncbi:hypothetical protein NKG94_31375 [Micromonospora sp. M12]
MLAGDLAIVYADQLTFDFAPPARRLWNEMRTELIVGQHLDVAVAAEAVVDARLSRWIAVCKSGATRSSARWCSAPSSPAGPTWPAPSRATACHWARRSSCATT